MRRAAILSVVVFAALAFLAQHAAAGNCGSNIIRVYYPHFPKWPVCEQEDGCGPSGCPFGQARYTILSRSFTCDNAQATNCPTPPDDVFGDWYDANVPQDYPEVCENPFSGVFNGCNGLPEPNDCREPLNSNENVLGDPVDLTSGALEQSAVDVDLGNGLRFERHYASDRTATTRVGKGWTHSLDWELAHEGDADAEIVFISRPLASKAVFVRISPTHIPNETWKSGMRGAGGLEGEASTGFSFTDDDGTRVTFAGGTFEFESIRHPGAKLIDVEHGGSTTTFATADACLVVTESASKVSSVVARMNGSCDPGSSDPAWTYTYDTPVGCLRTVTGPSPANSSESLVWTYTYPLSGGNCSNHNLTKIERTVGSASATKIGEWSFGSGRVTSAHEPALAQDLCLGYEFDSYDNLATSVCAVPTSGTCAVWPADTCGESGATPAPLAVFTSNSGRLIEVNGVGGPGVPTEPKKATFTPIGEDGAAPGLWRTKKDQNGYMSWLDGYDARGRPGRIVEGWIDTVDDDVFGAGDDSARLREFSYHPRLDSELTVTQTSVLNSSGSRVEINDYDADLDSVPNEAASDLLHRRVVRGWTLDASGSQVQFTDTTTYSYDGNDRLTEIAGPRSAQLTTIAYDPTTGSRSSIRRYLNGASSSYLEWTFSDFDARGNPQTVTDPNARATNFTYDSLGRVRTAKPPCESGTCTGADDTTVTFTYDVDGNLTRVQFPDDSASADVFLELGYDAAKPDQLRFIKDSQGNAIVYTYVKGGVTSEARYTGFTSLTSLGTKVGDATFSYTAAGHLFRAFNPLFGGGTVYAEFGHDAKGNPTAIEDESDKDDVLVYDALDRLTQIQQVRTATYETEFTYDALSNVTSVTDASGKATDLLHDDRGNLVETVSPDTGRTRFLYDAAGNLTQKIENAPETGTSGARITSYVYDGLDRLLSIDLPNDPDWTFTYDTAAAQNQKGRLASVTNDTTITSQKVTTSFEYTRRGDVARERTTIDGHYYDVAYAYDAAGNRSEIIAPSLDSAATAYAGLRPSQLAITGGSRTELIDEIAWYPFGPRTSAKLPPDDSNGDNTVTSTRTVNLRGQIERIQVTRPGTTLLDREYEYDEIAGSPLPDDPGPNLDQMIDHVDTGESRSYFYDDLDRLAKATNLAGTTTLHEYAYDAVGNRTSKTSAAGTTSYGYIEDSNRLDDATGVEAVHYAHDAYGNRIWEHPDAYDDTPSLVYNDENRLVQVLDPSDSFSVWAAYTYDAFGRRVRKQTGGQTALFFYDTEGHLIAEVEKKASAADLSRTYVYLEDELVALIDKAKEVGTAVAMGPTGKPIEIEPIVLFAILALLGGVGAGLATRRAPIGIATTTSGAAMLLLCAGTPQQPRMAFVHTDPLGTPFGVTNAPTNPSQLAKVVWKASYEPFGKATVNEDPDGDTGTFSLAVRFPGQYEDAETGWHYNYFRTYDPSTGRYLEMDPIGLQDGPNLFLYARGNPLRYIDRNGGAVDDFGGWGFPTEDEHFNRNRNNYCPKQPPKDCPGWDQDEGGALGTKYRSDRGFECAYDQNGTLLPDITKWNWLGAQNYSFNYGAGRFPWTPRHVWQDFIPHFWYRDQFWFGDQPGRYPAAQTSTGTDCDCPRP